MAKMSQHPPFSALAARTAEIIGQGPRIQRQVAHTASIVSAPKEPGRPPTSREQASPLGVARARRQECTGGKFKTNSQPAKRGLVSFFYSSTSHGPK